MTAYIPWHPDWTYSLRYLAGSWVMRIWTWHDDALHMRAVLKHEFHFTGPYICKPVQLERV